METQERVQQLKSQLIGFLSRLENLDPNDTSLDDIDQLIKMVEKMEDDLSFHVNKE
ncbi:SE1561 family protein [Aquibacillus albus]|uniref:Spo0E family sporulation regulatory protein-aspartic acid phosphatase n=1 Tax=Aquibacillus albus TaxID=1168171 RepID=A0ABS2N2S6_9BACI|nr:SE1561 family protein [Aquibacillus albus]MBM7572427.1 hypothetical protein [Aquibacillus albus]